VDLVSRWITTDDKKIDKMDDFEIPVEWWSRPYEYKFCGQFLKKNDIVLDGACGIEHPFKYYASKRVNKCYAVDRDERILGLKENKKLEFRHLDLMNLDKEFEENFFDKIFCISVLEHITPVQNIKKILENFKKLIKPDGYIVLTIDHPYLGVEHFINYVNASGLTFASEADYEKPKNILRAGHSGLKCYRAVLQKYEDNKEDVKSIQPDEIKPEFPEENK
jgi:SAM-dependent methyltransferase